MKSLNVTSIIEHNHEGLPRFVCIPMKAIEPWKLSGTTTVELSINGVPFGRRSLKRWDERNCLVDGSFERCLPESRDRNWPSCEVEFEDCSEELPAELLTLIRQNPKARRRWESFTSGQQRMLREEILAAKQPATRARRAARALGV